MKKNETIKNKISIILGNKTTSLSMNYERVDGIKAIFNSQGSIIVNKPEEYKFTNKHVILLKSLYLQLDLKTKKEFVTYLLKYIKSGNISYGKTALNALIHIGEFTKSFKSIQNDFSKYTQEVFYSHIFIELTEIIEYEWNIFKPSEITEIASWIDKTINKKNSLGSEMRNYSNLYKNFIPVFNRLCNQINQLNFDRLEKEIYEGFNPEINEDKEKLIIEFNKYDFPKDLAQTLDVIDQKISNASNGFDFKECMGHIRTFTERFYESIANSIDIENGKKINSIDSEEVAKFFIKKKLISEDQGKILTSLQHFLSNLGVHRLKSKAEDARLSRNMAIEFSLYLMRKIKDTRN